ncbi:MAG: DNA repair protein RecN [Tissierellia bacterium]|nr:DNA repair protein RecN [Tissierellia bacterium]
MLFELFIDNFVIIKKQYIRFEDGFNVITGETGSGKSLILDAINLILGDRAKKEYIGNFSDKTIVEAVFIIKDKEKEDFFESKDISLDENKLIITRIIRKSSSTIRINGRISTLETLKEISSILVDIYNQNDNTEFINKSNYINLLDTYKNDDDTIKLLSNLKKLDDKKNNLNNKLSLIDLDDKELIREVELLRFQIDEIEKADIENLDEDKLDSDYKRLNSITELKEALEFSKEKISGYDYNNPGIIDIISKISSKLEEFSDIDNEVNDFYQGIIQVEDQLSEIYSAIDYYSDNLYFDENELNQLEDKIHTVFDLKRKYGSSLDEVIDYYNTSKKRLEELENSTKLKKDIFKDIENINDEMLDISKKLHDIRINKSIELEDKINESIHRLNIKNGLFSIKLKEKTLSNKGIDNVLFLIRTNKGESLKSLEKTASGGELSRIMLAFKEIYSDFDKIDTLIFDEIDQGISGRTAQIVAEKISNISKARQIISVSHLPQIASFADNHILVSKKDTNDSTITSIDMINGEDRIHELARLIGGVDITDKTYSSAKEMLDMASNLKKENKNE